MRQEPLTADAVRFKILFVITDSMEDSLTAQKLFTDYDSPLHLVIVVLRVSKSACCVSRMHAMPRMYTWPRVVCTAEGSGARRATYAVPGSKPSSLRETPART